MIVNLMGLAQRIKVPAKAFSIGLHSHCYVRTSSGASIHAWRPLLAKKRPVPQLFGGVGAKLTTSIPGGPRILLLLGKA